VRMRVQSWEFLVPASLASSNLGMPVRRVRLEPSFFFRSLDCLKLAHDRIASLIGLLITF
jgi:hypothetical protein